MRSIGTRSVALATLFAFVTTSCGSKSTTTSAGGGGSGGTSDVVVTQPKSDGEGLDLRVSNGTQGAPAYDRAKLAPATKLAEAEAEALLKRAPAIKSEATDTQSFALRPRSAPPPRTGTTVHASFPPDPSTLLPPKASEAGKDLKVLRWMPEGAVPLAPELSVTFSQPMVAVTSQDDAAKTQPVKLTPTPKGRWRWIGTRTILFDPEVRFPQATTYKVEIPAGTKSATGGTLAQPVTFSFETPPPTIVSSYPNSEQPQHVDVPMFVLFDQKIDVQSVLTKLTVTANGKPVDVQLLDAAAIAKGKDKQLQSVVEAVKKDEQDGRWLAFRSLKPLPSDAAISVELGTGTPSAEGGNVTKAPQSFGFRTYPPLKIVKSNCGYGDECRPGMPFVIEFNNPIDPDKFNDQVVGVSPDIPGMKLMQSYTNVIVNGMTKARTDYKVVVAGGITDEFGQTLGKDESMSFEVGDAMPYFWGPNGVVVLDPAAKKPTLDFFTTNYEQLKVRLYKVTPADYDAFAYYIRNAYNHDHPPPIPGTKAVDTLVATTGGKNEIVETHVDLTGALAASGLGHVLAIVEPYPWTERREPPRMVSWVQSTKLAIDAHVDADQLIAFATELATGKPAGNVALELHSGGVTATTDDKGMATLALPAAGPKGLHYLVAKRGDDVAFVPEDNGYYREVGSWFKQPRPQQLAWYVIDDRQMYKPGEEVSLKGWLRIYDPGKEGDIAGIAGQVTTVTYTVRDSQNNQIAAGTAPVNAVGGFDTKFTLPKTPNLGYTNITFAAQGRMAGAFSHAIQVQEFRRPEFEVTAQASQGPFLVGGAGDVTVSAKYYAGGPLAGAPVNWNVTASQTSFTPPNRDEFIFGAWTPWWESRNYDDEGEYRYKPPKTWTLASKTDATGAHVMHLDFLGAKPSVPMAVMTNAAVTDVNRQTWSAATSLIVHPSSYYVGLKTQRSFVEKGQPFPIDVIGVDLDGKAVAGAKIELKAARLDWEYKKGRYQVKEVDPQSCPVVAAKDPVKCELSTAKGGTYQVTATIVDDKGRSNQTKLMFWVSGGDTIPAREVAQERVQLIPDKKEYAPGGTAQMLALAPFYPAEGIVSWRRSGIVKTERVTFDGPSKTITVPITDAMTPNLYVQVDLVGAAARTGDNGAPDPSLPKRPAYAVGSIDLPIPAKHRTLAVKVTPAAAKLAPGAKTQVAVEVRDAAGKPVANAETAVIVVDESILALTGYQFANPIDVFYHARPADARDAYMRAQVKLAKPAVDALAANKNGDDMGRAMGGAPGAAAATPAMVTLEAKLGAKEEATKPTDGRFDRQKGDANIPAAPPAEPGAPPQPIAIRQNFNPLAAFSPVVKTNADGKATVDVKMPDNLTRYRVVAVSAANDREFGKGESAVTARLPLMVRPSPPRFLNFGDTFRLPVVVQNQTDSPMTVKVAIRATNATISDGAGRQLTVPPNDRLEVQFPAAAEMAGTARFQIIGSAGDYSDAAEVNLPVWTPATTEAFATYGVIDAGVISQPVALPGRVVTQFGGIEVTTSSTNLQALTDAVIYLVHYPFECAEQRSSRILALAALKDVLTAFKSKDLPSPAAMETSVKTDIDHLSQMQNGDGGFAYWDRGYPSEPYLTVFVTNALTRAQAKGFAVPAAILNQAKVYLRDIESHYPWYYSKEVRWAISAYALYTRKQMGDLDIAKGQKLLRDAGGVDKVTMETDGWLLGLFAGNAGAATERQAIVRHALNKVSETAGAANFTTSYGDGAYLLLASDRRVDGVMLESLIQEQKDLDLIPKVVTGLLAHRKAGHWLNTQENAFVLTALDLYFNTYEKTTPDFVARVWLGNDYAGDKQFKGRSTDYQVDIPMKDVATHDKSDLTIQKDGAGRLYYRIGMTYAPASLKLDPADYGFVVTRTYEGVDDPKDVTHAADGTWHIKAGARVRVRLTMINENRRYHVALVDPLPAGLETMNPALAVTGPIPTDPNEQKSRGAYWWWYGPWYEHQNMRDERVEAFAAMLWEGVHRYDYVARATTPGNFVVPPPKAEEMYMPETFGRGGGDRVIVE